MSPPPPHDTGMRGGGGAPPAAPTLRDLIRATAAAPDVFDALARRLLDQDPGVLDQDMDAVLPEIDLLARQSGTDPNEPSVAVTESGAIVSASPAAMQRFALSGSRNQISALGLQKADFTALKARMARHPGVGSIVMTHPPGMDAPLLMAAEMDDETGILHLRPLTPAWPPALDGVLADLYSLSPREREVLRALHAGANAREIADLDGRALGTVRQQIKSILSKLGMNSQGQVQTFLAAASTALRGENPGAASRAAPTAGVQELVTERTGAGGARVVGFRRFGDAGGLPCLMLHGALYGLGTHAAERMSAQVLGLNVIGPERAGYGRTLPGGDNDPRDQRRTAAQDALACMDAAGAGRAVVVAHDTGLVTALTLAAMAPDRIAGIVAVSATPPLFTWEDSAGMPPQQRIFALCMLRAPALADALVTLGLARMRRLGHAAWPQAVFAGVPHDVTVSREPANLAAVTAAYAFNTTQAAAGFRLDMADLYRDWDGLPARVACPVLFLHGAQNRTVDPARIPRFAQGFADARIELIEGAGHTLALSHPALILRRAMRLAWAAGME